MAQVVLLSEGAYVAADDWFHDLDPRRGAAMLSQGGLNLPRVFD